jgi:uncharacterized protein YdgA (DUF945 family)
MSKKAVIASSILAILGVSWAGTTWYSGHKVESVYQQYIQQFNQETLSPVSIKLTSFERGFLSSKANWEIAYAIDPCQPNDKITLAGYDNIHQGFIPSLGWASIDSHIILPDDIQAKAKEIFGDKEPLQIYSRINWLGNLSTSIKSPAVEWANKTAKINWQGLDGDIKFSGDQKVSFDIKAPKLLVIDNASDDKQFSIEKIRYQGEQHSEQTFLPVGEVSFEVQSIDLKNAGQQWAVKQLTFKNKNQIKDQLLSATGDYNIGHIELNKKNIGDFKSQIAVDNLDADAVQKTYKSFTQLQKQCNPSPSQMIEAFKPMLIKGLSFKVNHLDLKLFDGHATSKAAISIPALNDTELKNPEQVLQKINANALVQVSNSLLTGVLQEANQLKGEPISPAEATQHVQMLLEGYVKLGWLSKTATGYQAAFDLKSGVPSLNGKPFNQPTSPAASIAPAP